MILENGRVYSYRTTGYHAPYVHVIVLDVDTCSMVYRWSDEAIEMWPEVYGSKPEWITYQWRYEGVSRFEPCRGDADALWADYCAWRLAR